MPKVYLESSSTSPKIGELGTYSGMSSTGQVTRITNGYNVAKDLKLEFPKVEWEWVVKQNPGHNFHQVLSGSEAQMDEHEFGFCCSGGDKKRGNIQTRRLKWCLP